MTSGVFLDRLASRSRPANALHLRVSREQVPPSSGDRAGVEAKQFADLLVATVSDLQRLESCIETALLFIEEAVEEHDRGFQLFGEHAHSHSQTQERGLRLIDLTRGQLMSADRGIHCDVDKSIQ